MTVTAYLVAAATHLDIRQVGRRDRRPPPTEDNGIVQDASMPNPYRKPELAES